MKLETEPPYLLIESFVKTVHQHCDVDHREVFVDAAMSALLKILDDEISEDAPQTLRWACERAIGNASLAKGQKLYTIVDTPTKEHNPWTTTIT